MITVENLKRIRKRFRLTIKDPLIINDKGKESNFTFYFGKIAVNSLVKCLRKNDSLCQDSPITQAFDVGVRNANNAFRMENVQSSK